MKWLVYVVFALLFIAITFFGIGPVLLADGSMQERMLTLFVVLLIYALLILALRFFLNKSKIQN